MSVHICARVQMHFEVSIGFSLFAVFLVAACRVQLHTDHTEGQSYQLSHINRSKNMIQHLTVKLIL